MEAIVGLVLFILLFTLLIIFIIRYSRKKSREKNELYKELGLRLGLTYSETKRQFMILPSLNGKWKDKELTIYEKVVGSGKNQSIFTIIEFSESPHDFKFRIGKEHFFSKIGKKLGYKDIEFDQEELDRAFLFKSEDEDRFRAMMNYKLLHDLSGITENISGKIENKDGKLTYTIPGIINKPNKIAQLESVLGFLGKLMEA